MGRRWLALLLALALAWGPVAPARALAVAAGADLPPDPGGVVVELLRLQVPRQAQPAWLAAERSCWEPWLRRQEGFLGRELLYDARQEQALVLIRWASREHWQAIPAAEVERMERRFRHEVRRRLG
ncbi:MAG: TIGR03792 family protein, partial [Prochlorococcaceae cyanobacterium]